MRCGALWRLTFGLVSSRARRLVRDRTRRLVRDRTRRLVCDRTCGLVRNGTCHLVWGLTGGCNMGCLRPHHTASLELGGAGCRGYGRPAIVVRRNQARMTRGSRKVPALFGWYRQMGFVFRLTVRGARFGSDPVPPV